MLLASKDSSAFVVGNLCGYFKHTINYDKTRLKKLDKFYATTWLIFAGSVTYIVSNCILGNFRGKKVCYFLRITARNLETLAIRKVLSSYVIIA